LTTMKNLLMIAIDSNTTHLHIKLWWAKGGEKGK